MRSLRCLAWDSLLFSRRHLTNGIGWFRTYLGYLLRWEFWQSFVFRMLRVQNVDAPIAILISSSRALLCVAPRGALAACGEPRHHIMELPGASGGPVVRLKTRCVSAGWKVSNSA